MGQVWASWGESVTCSPSPGVRDLIQDLNTLALGHSSPSALRLALDNLWASRSGSGVPLPGSGRVTPWTCPDGTQADGWPQGAEEVVRAGFESATKEFIRKTCTLMESHLPSTRASPQPYTL